MKKFFKWFAIIALSLVVILFIAFRVMVHNTKRSSPEATVSYDKNGLKMEVFYCRPSKKGREIFGGLVPYGKVWRTGANEATTFETNQPLVIGGKTLPAGKYTLWTIPNSESWEVIFNSKQYDWGINWDGEALREPALDVLTVNVPVQITTSGQELFTISFSENPAPALELAWDKTRVSVPLGQ